MQGSLCVEVLDSGLKERLLSYAQVPVMAVKGI